MTIHRYLRLLSVSSSLARSAHRITPKPALYISRVESVRAMSVSNAPHPVSSTAQPPKAAEGLEPVTAGASSTPTAAKEGKPKQDKPAKAKKEKGGGSSGPLELNPPPGYFEERIKIFDEYKAKYQAEVAGKSSRVLCPVITELYELIIQPSHARPSRSRCQTAPRSRERHGRRRRCRWPRTFRNRSPKRSSLPR